MIMLLERWETSRMVAKQCVVGDHTVAQTEWTQNIQKVVDAAHQATTKIAAGNDQNSTASSNMMLKGLQEWESVVTLLMVWTVDLYLG